MWEAGVRHTVSLPPRSCPRAPGWRPGRQRENQGRGLGVPRPPRVQPQSAPPPKSVHRPPPCDHQEPGQDARRGFARRGGSEEAKGCPPHPGHQPCPRGAWRPSDQPGREARPQGRSLAEQVQTLNSRPAVGGLQPRSSGALQCWRAGLQALSRSGRSPPSPPPLVSPEI